MISVAEAKKMINESVAPLAPVERPLAESWNCTLAENVIAPYDIPAYPQSSMDGYAIAFKDITESVRNGATVLRSTQLKTLKIEGESAAGNRQQFSLSKGSAARIFTGAAVPDGADTVVMQEKVRVLKDSITIEDDSLTKGMNVRAVGSEIRKGEVALVKGAQITAAASGFLANIGITSVMVTPQPRVAIVLTGNELKQTGEALGYGEVYESNAIALRSALKQFNIVEPQLFYAKDDQAEITAVLKSALETADLVLLTGGVSVGEYDFVIGAANECGVHTVFHKIRQRPGKPLFFGMKDKRVIFGLPGNPSSVLTCFYEYVLIAIGLLSKRKCTLPELNVPVKEGFEKKIRFTQFLKGYFDGNEVTVLASQESYKMNSFAKANCFVVMNEEDERLEKGDIAHIHVIS